MTTSILGVQNQMAIIGRLRQNMALSWVESEREPVIIMKPHFSLSNIGNQLEYYSRILRVDFEEQLVFLMQNIKGLVKVEATADISEMIPEFLRGLQYLCLTYKYHNVVNLINNSVQDLYDMRCELQWCCLRHNREEYIRGTLSRDIEGG